MTNGQGEGLPAVAGSPSREGERSENERNGEPATAVRGSSDRPDQVNGDMDPEIQEKAHRRRFTAAYKLEILQKAEECTRPGQLGALLRRERLYHSNLTQWRRQKEKKDLEGLAPRKRGNKVVDDRKELSEENRRLRREVDRLEKRLNRAETIIDIQKKISEMLGIPQNPVENDEND